MTNQDHAATPPRAAIYLRFATVDPAGHKLAVVRDACEKRAAELGAIVVVKYIDFGSGLNGERPELTRMLNQLTDASITYVVAPQHSTVARNMQDYARIVWAIEQAGARLVVASTPLENYQVMKSNPLGLQQTVADWACNERTEAPAARDRAYE